VRVYIRLVQDMSKGVSPKGRDNVRTEARIGYFKGSTHTTRGMGRAYELEVCIRLEWSRRYGYISESL